MYNNLKKYIKKIISKDVLIKNELLFRGFYGLFYIGKTHQCNICNKKLRGFVKLKNHDLLCPFCGSLSRNRRLLLLMLQDNYLKENVLHFSPSRSLYRFLKHKKDIRYFSTDFENEFLSDYQFDITSINQLNDKFSTIICFHILEHIEKDKQAMQELFRVLKPNGKAYIQTPFKDGTIYEDHTIVSSEEREKHFGQKDHVRIYSAEGLKQRLIQVGFNVSLIHCTNKKEDLYFGLKSPELILVAS